MKTHKLLFLTLLSCFAISCSQDTLDDQAQENQSDVDIAKLNAAGYFDNSFEGIYKGLFTTNDGLTRGTVMLTVSQENQPGAQITLSSGENIKLKGSGDLFAKNATKNLNFSSVGVNSANVNFDFSVEDNGLFPNISNVIFDNKASNILIAKELSRAPLNTITGTYERTSGNGPFPDSGRTWNIMSIGSGDQTYSMQVFYNGKIYNSIDSGFQTNCSEDGFITSCDIEGTITIATTEVSYSGVHMYDNFEDNQGCSDISGTWSAPSYGNSVGTFVSDSDCEFIEIVNDVCGDASTVSIDSSVNGTTEGSTTTGSPGEGECDDNLFFNDDTVENGVWYVYTAAADVDVQVDTEGSTDLTDTQLRVFSGTCGALTCVANDDDAGTGLLSLVTFSATAGESYYIYVGGYSDNEGAFVLNISDVTPPPVIPFDLNLTCGESMVDNGTNISDYTNDSFDTYLIDAGVGSTISLNFSEFNTENTWDFVQVYDGADSSAPLITTSVGGNTTVDFGDNDFGFTGNGDNSLNADSVVSTGQFMTVIFVSDGSTVASGFVADVVCVSARPSLGQSRTSSTFTPQLSTIREKHGINETIQLLPGEAKTEAYILSELQQ